MRQRQTDDRELVARNVRPDSRHRVSLGAAIADLDDDASFNVYRDAAGRIILEPQVSIPAAEAWLFRNKRALDLVRRGLKEAAAGDVRYLGSFAQYADDDES
jgi:hypothetical protein